MKNLGCLFTIFCILLSCKNEQKKDNSVDTTKENTVVEKEKTRTTAEEIAHANGFENWKNVSEIKFTFNVDRGESHFERTWNWKPQINEVTLTSAKDTITYNRSKIDSISIATDQGFINDKYWLLAPFNLVWDKGTKIATQDIATAPISKEKMQKLTLLYGDQGGYTPGDAYDFYFKDDFIVQEWVFRKGNSDEPSMTTTWEDYEDFNGLKIAKMHTDKEGALKLYFSNIEVTK